MSETGTDAWPGGIAAITLFVEDLEAAKRFYQEVSRLPVVQKDENSAVFRFGQLPRSGRSHLGDSHMTWREGRNG